MRVTGAARLAVLKRRATLGEKGFIPEIRVDAASAVSRKLRAKEGPRNFGAGGGENRSDTSGTARIFNAARRQKGRDF